MLKSLELKGYIRELKAEINDGIAQNIDMTAKAQELDSLLSRYQEAVAEEKKLKKEETINMSEQLNKKSFNRVIKALLCGRQVNEADKAYMPKVVDTATGNYAGADAAGGYLIPEEFMDAYALNEGMVNLAQYVDVVPVAHPSGKIPTIDYSQPLELADFTNDNDTEIAKKSAAFGQTPFVLGTRGALIPVARELMQDADTDVIAIINKLFARAEIQTTNKDILTAAQESGVQTMDAVNFTTDAVLDAIKTALKAKLKISDASNAKVIMCQTDWAGISNLKDKQGRYLVQPIVTDPSKFAIDGHEVVVVEDADLEAGAIIVGNLKQLKKIVRVGYEVSADESAGFKTNSVLVRAIARFVVKNMKQDAFVIIPKA